MNTIMRPWMLLFILICAVAVVRSVANRKRGNKAVSVRSLTYDDPQERRKALKRQRGLDALRKIKRVRRQETYTYTVCVQTCNVAGAGVNGNILVQLVNSYEQAWGDYVTLSQDSGFEWGQCYCADFVKPALSTVYPYNVIVKLDAPDNDEMKPYGVWVKGPSQISFCDYLEQCDFWTETCWMVNEYPRRIHTCYHSNLLPSCPL